MTLQLGSKCNRKIEKIEKIDEKNKFGEKKFEINIKKWKIEKRKNEIWGMKNLKKKRKKLNPFNIEELKSQRVCDISR